jgi:hypothetical protein
MVARRPKKPAPKAKPASFASDLLPGFKRVRRIAKAMDLPEVEEGSWYGTPGITVAGKGILRMKDADSIAILCPLELKEMLMAAAPDIYFETDHYKGYDGFLMRLSAASDDDIRQRIETAWRMREKRKIRPRHRSTTPRSKK